MLTLFFFYGIIETSRERRKKLSRKSKFLIGIDTETANPQIDEKGKLDLSDSLVYDVGWIITDKKGNVYLKRSYVVAEIFLDPELMNTAYFKEKIPQYWTNIKNGTRILKRFLGDTALFFSFREYAPYNSV